ncbi:putative WD40-repeat-containing domain superfamily [Helianthus anomalus]
MKRSCFVHPDWLIHCFSIGGVCLMHWMNEGKDEKKQLQHFSLFGGGLYNSISAVRWNPSNQDEIAYTSPRSDELTIFDIGYSQEVQCTCHDTLNRVLASDISGAISMWDRRASVHPQRVLTTKKITGLTSIQSLGDQIYAVASTSSNGLHLLDFYPHSSSQCHVDYE